MSDWHYEHKGQALGPVTIEEMNRLIRKRTVRGETLVWRDGMGDWLPARDTELAEVVRETELDRGTPTQQARNIPLGGLVAIAVFLAAIVLGGFVALGNGVDVHAVVIGLPALGLIRVLWVIFERMTGRDQT